MPTPNWDSYELNRTRREDAEGNVTYHWPDDTSPEQWLRSFQEQYPECTFDLAANPIRAVIVRR